jgi:excisionase family DNA binding protein
LRWSSGIVPQTQVFGLGQTLFPTDEDVILPKLSSQRRADAGLSADFLAAVEDAVARLRPVDERIGYSVAELVRLSSLGRQVIYDALGQGALRAKKLGRRTVIPRAEVDAWLSALPDWAAAVDQGEDQ